MRNPTYVIAAVAIVAVGLVFALRRPSVHHLKVTSYFQDAQGLRPGARVRTAGVEVGTVTSVRVRPELRDHPAEIVMDLNTPYELKIPDDSVVMLETAGVLGDTFPEINIQGATGHPLESGGVLKSRESSRLTTQQVLDCLSNAVEHKPCDLSDKTAKTDRAPKSR